MTASAGPSEAYRRALGVSAQHKARALSLLAEGGDAQTRTAVVLLHEAWRAERRAVRALESPSPETLLRAAVEACGCLVDARDPSLVHEVAWGEVLDASAAVAPEVAAALRRRLDPRVEALMDEYGTMARSAPDAFAIDADLRSWRRPRGELESAHRQTEKMLRSFPGDPRIWRAFAFTAEHTGRPLEAWEAIRRSREIDPEDSAAAGAEVHLSVKVLPDTEARAFVSNAATTALRGAMDMDYCLPVLHALMSFTRGAPDDRVWWERVFELASQGLALPEVIEGDRKLCRLAFLIAREHLAGRTPTVDLLFRVGLGALVPRIPPAERDDVVKSFQALDRRPWSAAA